MLTCIYLDNNATTPLDPRVLEAMLPYLKEHFGNASSKSHPYGWKAGEAVEMAREQVASLIGAAKKEIIFTGGATEANNMALLGFFHGPGASSASASTGSASTASSGGRGKPHAITQATEHHAILDTARELQRRGVDVTILRPDPHGRISPEAVRDAITDRTRLVSIMMANNEIGTLQPVREIGALLRERGILFQTDAAQAVGKIPIDVGALGVDLLALSAHKFYGPKGVGALYVRARTPPIQLSPLLHGGGQERGLRPGTLNVAGIVGLGEACRIARAELQAEAARLAALRKRLLESITSRIDGVILNGHPEERLPGNLSLSFDGVDGSALMVSLPDLALSSGSACTTGSAEPSYVLKAIGLSDRRAMATVRVGLGRFTTEEEVDRAAARLAEEVARQRSQLASCR